METATKKVKVLNHVKSPGGKQIVLPKVDMVFGAILTSCEEGTKGKLITSKMPSTKQVVVAAADNSWLKVGDIVELDFTMFPYTTKPGKHDVGSVRTVILPEEYIDNRKYLYCTDRHVKYRHRK